MACGSMTVGSACALRMRVRLRSVGQRPLVRSKSKNLSPFSFEDGDRFSFVPASSYLQSIDFIKIINSNEMPSFKLTTDQMSFLQAVEANVEVFLYDNTK